jgi:hypothetical protein
MTRDEAKQFLPIIQAYAEGKTIQCRQTGGQWLDGDFWCFDTPASRYRIKPEPVECWAAVGPDGIVAESFSVRLWAEQWAERNDYRVVHMVEAQ